MADDDFFKNGLRGEFQGIIDQWNRFKSPNGWYGDMLEAHTIRLGADDAKLKMSRDTETSLGKVGESPDVFTRPVFNDALPFSKRATLMLNNDLATDYFLHDTLISSPGNSSILGGLPQDVKPEAAAKSLLDSFAHTSFENQDPVIYGFEVIIDAISSPLLNGSVEDFIDLASNVSEIETRRQVLFDFKKQFEKLFKTKGGVRYRQKEIDKFENSPLFSDTKSGNLGVYAGLPTSNSKLLSTGKKAYLGHYLNKIEGLHLLHESNLGDTKKYIVDYRKDFIKLTFNEDVSGTLSALTHLYKMLYWSRPNQKNLIPENLLRFNCEIVVSEVRSFNRIRNYMRTMDVGNSEFKLQVIKDNVSRYVYSLRECQFYFNTPAHDDAIDYSTSNVFGGQVVQFDFKYSSMKYEKWVSDPDLFGKYVSYHNGAIWKVGSRGGRVARSLEMEGKGAEAKDYSNPKFFSVGGNSLGQNGVTFPIELMNYRYKGPEDAEVEEAATVESTTGVAAPQTEEDDPDGNAKKRAKKKGPVRNVLRGLGRISKKVGMRTARSAYYTVRNEVAAQIGVRYNLLKNTVRKIGNLTGITDQQYVYPRPYTPVGMGIFFDVRNELYNFWGEEISTIMANAANIANPFAVPAVEGILSNELKKKDAPSVWFNPLNQLLKKYSDIPSIISDGQPANLQSGIVDGKYNYPVQFPDNAQKSSNTIKSGGELKVILDEKARFKPKNEGNGTPGTYIFKDPQEGTTINVPSVPLPGGGSTPAFTLTLPGFGPNTSVKQKPGGVDVLLNKYSDYNAPADEKVDLTGVYKFKDPQVGIDGPGFGPNSSTKADSGGLEALLNANAKYNKPSEEKLNSYIFKDPNVNFGGGAVPDSSDNVKSKGSLIDILNAYANFKPNQEGDGTIGSYIFLDPQEPKAGFNYPANTQGSGFGFSALGKQSVDAKNTKINDLLNKNATINKPSDQGIAISPQGLYYVTGAYTFKDPNVGFGGATVPTSSDDVKSKGSLKSILDAYANFKPKDEGDGTAGSYTFLDQQEPKAGTNYPSTSPQGVGFGFSGLGKQSVDAKNATLNSLLNDNAIFKPKDEGNVTPFGVVPDSYKFKDPNIGFGGMGGQGIKAQGSLEAILNSGAIFKPSDEGVSNGKLSGQYKFKDPNVNFGGAAVPQSSDNVKSQGSLEDIVKKNTKWPYPFNDKKFPRDI